MGNWQERISINPNIRFGRPCIKGTRISVGDIFAWLSHGMTYVEIIEDFPELIEEDIRAGLAFASHREHGAKTLHASETNTPVFMAT